MASTNFTDARIRVSSNDQPVNATRRRLLAACGCMTVGGAFTSLSAFSQTDEAPQHASRAWPAWRNPCANPEAVRHGVTFKGIGSDVQDLVAASFEGLNAENLWDVHAHLLGNGDSGSGCRLHPNLTQGFAPLERVRHRAILNAACVPDEMMLSRVDGEATGQGPQPASVDRAYVQRLLRLVEGFPAGARWCLFAFEDAHDDEGRARPDLSTFHIPNAYAAHVAKSHASRFTWVASIHPLRKDALRALDDALDNATGQGAVAIKWLPSAMNIDLRDQRLKPFYDRLAASRVPLVVHVGEEHAVPGAKRDGLGNPLHLRAPLSAGVRVVAAHCASLGHALDEDQKRPGKTSAFSLFERLMNERAHEGRLMGDISAVFQNNRGPEVWRTVIERQAWHDRLLQGSDYPLPGLTLLHRSAPWVRARMLDASTAARIDTLRRHNPLLADFVLKRSVRSRGARLAASVFETRSRLQR